MIEIMLTKGNEFERLEFETMNEALNYLAETRKDNKEVWMRFEPKRPNVCPSCGSADYRYNYTIDAMCCDRCGFFPSKSDINRFASGGGNR